ncbi:hypothetical protein HDU98_003982, partial [Podochytrium sp. JEL0797]
MLGNGLPPPPPPPPPPSFSPADIQATLRSLKPPPLRSMLKHVEPPTPREAMFEELKAKVAARISSIPEHTTASVLSIDTTTPLVSTSADPRFET